MGSVGDFFGDVIDTGGDILGDIGDVVGDVAGGIGDLVGSLDLADAAKAFIMSGGNPYAAAIAATGVDESLGFNPGSFMSGDFSSFGGGDLGGIGGGGFDLSVPDFGGRCGGHLGAVVHALRHPAPSDDGAPLATGGSALPGGNPLGRVARCGDLGAGARGVGKLPRAGRGQA